MKRTAIFLSSGLLFTVATGSFAQGGDPFTRAIPGAATPSLQGTATTPITLTGVQSATFGEPRFSTQGSATRVVFDLPRGVTYTLTPTFTGLRVDIQGARVLPSVTARLSDHITEYRAGGGQATLITPYPLSPTEGWRASEATIATGSRVLILELGAGVSGGPSASLQGRVLASAPTSAAAQAVLNTPLPGTLPPGDQVRSGPTLPPAPVLPGANPAQASALQGTAPGTPRAAQLSAPRIGKSPGQTRVVLDLPPGASYRISTGQTGLTITLTGVTLTAQSGANISPELRGWSFTPGAQGGTLSLSTATATRDRSGWRAQLLPPTTGETSRLAIDLSPALADLTPLRPEDRALQAVAPVPATRGTAVLAFSASFMKPRVVIDAGHGGRDPGAVGSVVEKDVTLAVALRVRDLLAPAGVDVVLTRDSDRELNAVKNVDLQMRAAMGTPGTQLFVSIHVNAMDARNALRGYGVETWWNPNHPQSSALAALIQSRLVEQTGAFNQGLKNTQSLSVLRNSRVPAALVEIGFASHPVDGLNLKDSNYLDRVALGIAQGIREALVTGVTADQTTDAASLNARRR